MEEVKKSKSKTVFYVSLAIVILTSLWSLVFREGFQTAASSAFSFLVGKFGWLYIGSMFSFVVFCGWLAFSRYGKIVLGKDGEKPTYSTISWFAMLFSCGMGVGLVFWGVAEPLFHWVGGAFGLEPGSAEAARFAMRKTLFHWGIHPWANYAVLGVGLAYMQFRKDKPALVSCVLEPLIGEKHANGGVGKFVDILAVFATVGGVATSFGLGALQLAGGLHYLNNGIPNTAGTQLVVILVITAIFMLSVVRGLDKGMKIISNANITIAIILMIAATVIGPTVSILNNMLTSTGDYIFYIFKDSLTISKEDWYGWWTVFYWAWWIAWAPFVAPFIVRISRGRTIREFVVVVMLVPTIASVFWFGIFGEFGMSAGLDVAKEATKDVSTALFVVFNQYPMGIILSLLSLLVLVTFFVTSIDGATFVLGMLSTNGNLNPPVSKKVIWGCVQALLAIVLLYAGGTEGLKMIQTSSIVAGFPFAIIMILGMFSLVKALKKENV